MGTIQFYKYKTQHARAAFLAKEMVRNALPENVVLFLFEKVYDTHLQICITNLVLVLPPSFRLWKLPYRPLIHLKTS